MLLAIDIGNTNVALGVFDGELLKATWRVSTEPGRMSDEYGLFLRQLLPTKGVRPGDVGAVAICSVVPPLTQTFVDLCENYFNVVPLVVNSGVRTGVKVMYDNPKDVGSDRIADAAAVMKLYGTPAIIVDFGTATVFDAVNRDGEYLGGAIAPGMYVAAEALFHRTSQLRRVDLSQPPSAIGRSTVHSLQSGLVLGYADLVKGMVGRFEEELGGECSVIATGGLAELMAEEVGVFTAVDLNLTLTGLRIIYELNIR